MTPRLSPVFVTLDHEVIPDLAPACFSDLSQAPLAFARHVGLFLFLKHSKLVASQDLCMFHSCCLESLCPAFPRDYLFLTIRISAQMPLASPRDTCPDLFIWWLLLSSPPATLPHYLVVISSYQLSLSDFISSVHRLTCLFSIYSPQNTCLMIVKTLSYSPGCPPCPGQSPI